MPTLKEMLEEITSEVEEITQKLQTYRYALNRIKNGAEYDLQARTLACEVLSYWSRGLESEGVEYSYITFKERVNRALDLASEYGKDQGDRYRAWCIDQMVRALHGAQFKYTTTPAGETETTMQANDEYKAWVEEVTSEDYPWETGKNPNYRDKNHNQ